MNCINFGQFGLQGRAHTICGLEHLSWAYHSDESMSLDQSGHLLFGPSQASLKLGFSQSGFPGFSDHVRGGKGLSQKAAVDIQSDTPMVCGAALGALTFKNLKLGVT